MTKSVFAALDNGDVFEVAFQLAHKVTHNGLNPSVARELLFQSSGIKDRREYDHWVTSVRSLLPSLYTVGAV